MKHIFTIGSLAVLTFACSSAHATQCDNTPIKVRPESIALLAKTKKIVCSLDNARFTATLTNTGRTEHIKNVDFDLPLFDTKFVREGNVFTRSTKWTGETRMMPVEEGGDTWNVDGKPVDPVLGGISLDGIMSDPCINDDPNNHPDPSAVPKFTIIIYKTADSNNYEADIQSSTLRFPEKPITGKCTLSF